MRRRGSSGKRRLREQIKCHNTNTFTRAALWLFWQEAVERGSSVAIFYMLVWMILVFILFNSIQYICILLSLFVISFI